MVLYADDGSADAYEQSLGVAATVYLVAEHIEVTDHLFWLLPVDDHYVIFAFIMFHSLLVCSILTAIFDDDTPIFCIGRKSLYIAAMALMVDCVPDVAIRCCRCSVENAALSVRRRMSISNVGI